MYLKLGNLTVAQFAEKVEAEFTDEELKFLESYRTNHASKIGDNEFHIFEHPSISINIGHEAMKDTLPVWTAANERKMFNQQIGFYPAHA